MHWIGWDFGPAVSHEGRFTPWRANVWDYYQAIDFDIGVIPLSDHAFNESKSHIKALEYSALGIPVVASDSAPYRDFVVDGVTGYLCRTPDEWRARLRELVNDADARAELGAAAKKLAAAHTIQDGWRLWNSAYEEVARG
jgi:glycosyltransferase involved in cell wall biosynthesis